MIFKHQTPTKLQLHAMNQNAGNEKLCEIASRVKQAAVN